MSDFLKFFNEYNAKRNFKLEIYYSGIMDWCINIYTKDNESIINIQNCDMEFVFARAQVEFKEYLLEHFDGY